MSCVYGSFMFAASIAGKFDVNVTAVSPVQPEKSTDHATGEPLKPTDDPSTFAIVVIDQDGPASYPDKPSTLVTKS